MNLIRNSTNKESIYGSLGSVLIHLLVVISIIILLNAGDEAYSSGGGSFYVDISDVKGAPSTIQPQSLPEENTGIVKPRKEIPYADKKPEAADLAEKAALNKTSLPPTGFYNIESAGFDSMSLGQLYREPTLNVKMKYPQGWVYVDQQRKKKLDGITFWASGTIFNPPPYIHVEVVDKYLFNPDQYKYKYDFEKCTGYYNEPVELENQVSQVIYLRTEDEEDYTIKLIMEDREAFKQFQPVFFAIVKSFEFGSSYF